MEENASTKYVVIEMQDGAIGDNWWAYDTRSDAEVKFHQVIAEAVKSPVATHTILFMTGDGFVIEQKVYRHKQEAA